MLICIYTQHTQHTQREVGESFRSEDVRAAIKMVRSQSAPGPSRLIFSQVHDALTDGLNEDVANPAKLVFSDPDLSDLFWALHTVVNLLALGAKA